jgi:acyl-CoA hydrolase
MPSSTPHRPAKVPSASHVELTELVLPNDTNQLGNLLGGRLMHWVDIAAALSAQRHSNLISVTASVDEMSFLMPVKLGQVVRMHASVNRAFHTSMEVGVHVDVEDFRTGDVRHVSTAFLTFVAIDEFGRSVNVPEIMPETDLEKRRYAEAEARRKHRLEVRDQRARQEKIRDQKS